MHRVSGLNTNVASPNMRIPGFLRLNEVGNVPLGTVPFTFHLHSYGRFPLDLILQLPLASTGGLNLPIALNSHTHAFLLVLSSQVLPLSLLLCLSPLSPGFFFLFA